MIITGHRSRSKVMGQLSFTCQKCQQKTYHEVTRVQRHFTLFWIPIIPLAKLTTTRCNNCGYKSYLDNKKADEWLGQPAGAAK